MTAVLFGTSNVTVEALRLYGVTVTWTGWDGSEWDLTDYRPGRLALASDGVVGFGWPEFVSQVTTSPAMDGQRLQGVATMPRMVEFSLHVRGEDSPDFTSLFSRFCRSWSPLSTGVLSVTTGTETRSIRLRLVGDPAAVWAFDPVFRRYMRLTVTAIADDPFWLGEGTEGQWSDGAVQDFLSAVPGRLLWISPAQTFATATITNRGDVPAWPVWEVTATTAALSGTISVDGGTIGLPTIAAGKTVIIDTDPARGYADLGVYSLGVFTKQSEIDGLLNPYDPRPVPVGADVPIGFDLTGVGNVKAYFRTRHWQAIGDA